MNEKNISVIGAGYIGAVLSGVLADKGNYVTAIDINKDILDCYRNGRAPVREPGLDKLINKVIKNGHLSVTDDFSTISESRVILITVGTPLKEDGSADKTAIKNVVNTISPYVKDGQLIIIKSTVPPFTTEKEIGLPLRKFAKVNVAFCPERLAEGNAIEECKTIPVIVGGIDKESGNDALDFWRKSLGVECINVQNSRSAELVKLADNAWIDLNIAIAFELSKLADNLDIDILPVIKAANTLPKGESKVNILTPSIGVGGYCLTKDPWFLNAFAKQYGFSFKTAIASRTVNEETPLYSSNSLHKKIKYSFPKIEPKNIKICILGLAFKNNTGDCRFTPTISFIENLSKLNYKLKIFDPNISQEDYKLFKFDNVQNENNIFDAMKGSNVLAFLAGHKEFHEIDLIDIQTNLEKGAIIFDGRMFFSKEKIQMFENNGFIFKGVGR